MSDIPSIFGTFSNPHDLIRIGTLGIIGFILLVSICVSIMKPVKE